MGTTRTALSARLVRRRGRRLAPLKQGEAGGDHFMIRGSAAAKRPQREPVILKSTVHWHRRRGYCPRHRQRTHPAAGREQFRISSPSRIPCNTRMI